MWPNKNQRNKLLDTGIHKVTHRGRRKQNAGLTRFKKLSQWTVDGGPPKKTQRTTSSVESVLLEKNTRVRNAIPRNATSIQDGSFHSFYWPFLLFSPAWQNSWLKHILSYIILTPPYKVLECCARERNNLDESLDGFWWHLSRPHVWSIFLSTYLSRPNFL